MQSSVFRHRSRRFAGLRMGAALLLAVQMVVAQTIPTQLQSGAQSQPDACSGPLGALMPECQPAGSSLSLPRSRGAVAGGSVQGNEADFEEEAVSRRMPAVAREPEAAPEAPSEFQRFVASSAGRLLPIFGASLFEKVPTTFAPLDSVPVTEDYVVGPGDEILLRVWGQQAFNRKLIVDRAGAVYIPQVGSVSVSGIQFRQLSDYLRSQLERVFRNFDLSVSMGQLRSIQILVVGQARRPAMYTVSALSTLVNALFASGGPSARGSMRRIQLKRGAKVAAELDLYDLLLRGDKSGDVRLLPEDVIYIPPVGSQVAVAGSVKNPAIYELKGETSVGELIETAGGLSPVADTQRATLERIKDGVAREMMELALNASGRGTQLANGDLLRVLDIVPKFENAVTLRGNVANPGRFGWRAGMRLRDIIPDKESLITRDYWKKRNLLGSAPIESRDLRPAPESEQSDTQPSEKQDPLMSPEYWNKRELRARLSPGEILEAELAADAQRQPERIRIESAVPDINWSYAVIERQNVRNLMADLIPFHLGKLVLEREESQNLELRSGDVITIFSQSDIRVPQMQQTRTIRLEGEFHAPGIYTVGPGETLGQIIQKAGGLTPQAYLFGAEFLRESTRLDQQKRMEKYIKELEEEAEKASRNRIANAASGEEATRLATEVQTQKQAVNRLRSVQATGRIVLSLKPESNDIAGISGMTLEDGDRFVVPARPATVHVMGEVYNPNSFVHLSNRRVGEYLHQAGGFTRNADEAHVYIICADGSVLPKKNTSNFSRLKLSPGDSIVVPEHFYKTTFVTGLRNWSQVISQLGLGAAAINVLR